MRDELPGWDDELDDEPRGRRLRPWILALALVPWLVVLGVVLGGVVHDGDPAPAPGAEGAAGPATGVAAGDGTTAAPPDAPDAPEGSDHPEDQAGDPAGESGTTAPSTHAPPGPPDEASPPDHAGVAALALAAARAWLTDIGPRLEVAGIEPHADLYLEHGVVERIDRHGDHAVVRVLAVVLERDGDDYAEVAPRRLAVPVALGPPPRPAGAPWWLAEPDLSGAPPSLVDEDDPGVLLAIGEALTAAGLGEREVVAASRTPDGWWLAETAARGDEDAPPAPVWLLPGSRGPIVAGADPRAEERDRKE